MNPTELLARLASTSVGAVFVCLTLADEYVTLVNNPTGNEVFDTYDQGIVIGKLMGICALMNEITDSNVDYATVIAQAFERADG